MLKQENTKMTSYDVYLIESDFSRWSMTWSGIFKVNSPQDLFEKYIETFSSDEKRAERSLENGEKANSFSVYDSFWGHTVAVFEPRSSCG